MNEEIEIRYRWGSPNSGNGTLHVLVDSIEFTTSEVAQGMNRYTPDRTIQGQPLHPDVCGRSWRAVYGHP